MTLPTIDIPSDLARDDMPDLLRHWYLGTEARRHMMMRRFLEVDRHLDRTRGARVLDVGSAWGFNVMALGRMGFEATGVDLIPAQFAVGRRIAAHNRVSFDVAGADSPHGHTVTYPDDTASVAVTFNTTAPTPEPGTPPRPNTDTSN